MESAPYKDHLVIEMLEQTACPEVDFDTGIPIDNVGIRAESTESGPPSSSGRARSTRIKPATMLAASGMLLKHQVKAISKLPQGTSSRLRIP